MTHFEKYHTTFHRESVSPIVPTIPDYFTIGTCLILPGTEEPTSHYWHSLLPISLACFSLGFISYYNFLLLSSSSSGYRHHWWRGIVLQICRKICAMYIKCHCLRRNIVPSLNLRLHFFLFLLSLVVLLLLSFSLKVPCRLLSVIGSLRQAVSGLACRCRVVLIIPRHPRRALVIHIESGFWHQSAGSRVLRTWAAFASWPPNPP